MTRDGEMQVKDIIALLQRDDPEGVVIRGALVVVEASGRRTSHLFGGRHLRVETDELRD